MTAVPKPTPVLKEPKPLVSRPNPIPTRIRNSVFARDDLLCQWCKVPGGSLDPHHIKRRSQGGPDKAWNLISVHRVCHQYIHEHPTEAKARGFLA